MKSVGEWTIEDVRKWLIASGFGRYAKDFCDIHQLDGKSLLTLTEVDLREKPLQMEVLGDIKRLMITINQLRQENWKTYNYLAPSCHCPVHPLRTFPTRLSDDDDSSHGEEERNEADSSFQETINRFDPQLWKTSLSFIYVFAVFLLTSFVMVIVHDRVPDMNKYPPLPDILLDNLPYIPWAFEACEASACIMSIMWLTILFFHKHRFILMRRMFSLTGTVFLLRCVTMLITSLSVPGLHLQCEARTSVGLGEQFSQAIKIWRGLGMTLQGVRTCGDYMFSGHTVCITLLNFFITEYCPRKMYFIHTASWVMNLFGVFFILAAHEHYSIDVFIAFYISSRLFLYYHTLANNQSLMQRDCQRTRVWFPLFSFFESKCDGIVPNEYEWPLPYPKSFQKIFQKSNGRKKLS